MARILIVEDEAVLRQALTRALARAGHEVMEAADGAAALEHLNRVQPDLVITDLYMPNVDGIELIARLENRATQTKVIAISGGAMRSEDEVLRMASRVGAERTLAKPFELDVLLAAVEDVLGRP